MRGNMKNLIVVSLAAAMLAVVAGPAAAHDGSPHYSFAEFYEDQTNTGFGGDEIWGVQANWVDPNLQDIPCPDASSDPENFAVIGTVITMHPGSVEGGAQAFIQLGYEKHRFRGAQGVCDSSEFYFWEWSRPMLDTDAVMPGCQGTCYNYGPELTPTAGTTTNRSFRIEAETNTGQCSTGMGWCFGLYIDSNRKHTTGGDAVEWDLNIGDSWSQAYVHAECKHDSETSNNCPVSHTDDNAVEITGQVAWYLENGDDGPEDQLAGRNWNGWDYGLVDYTEGMRGRWVAGSGGETGYATRSVVSFNEAVGTGSQQTDVDECYLGGNPTGALPDGVLSSPCEVFTDSPIGALSPDKDPYTRH
jgi:hypothetical protein